MSLRLALAAILVIAVAFHSAPVIVTAGRLKPMQRSNHRSISSDATAMSSIPKRSFMLVNIKSGGNQGSAVKEAVEKKGTILAISLFDLGTDPASVKDKPTVAQHVAKMKSCLQSAAHQKKRARVICAGGDGTASWCAKVIQSICQGNRDCKWAPIMIPMPLGTGCDLSQTMGWGDTMPSDLDAWLEAALHKEAEYANFDTWAVQITSSGGECSAQDSNFNSRLQPGAVWPMFLYVSMGFDAKCAYDFQRSQSELFGQFVNKMKHAKNAALTTTDMLKLQNLGARLQACGPRVNSHCTPNSKYAQEEAYSGLCTVGALETLEEEVKRDFCAQKCWSLPNCKYFALTPAGESEESMGMCTLYSAEADQCKSLIGYLTQRNVSEGGATYQLLRSYQGVDPNLGIEGSLAVLNTASMTSGVKLWGNASGEYTQSRVDDDHLEVIGSSSSLAHLLARVSTTVAHGARRIVKLAQPKGVQINWKEMPASGLKRYIQVDGEGISCDGNPPGSIRVFRPDTGMPWEKSTPMMVGPFRHDKFELSSLDHEPAEKPLG